MIKLNKPLTKMEAKVAELLSEGYTPAEVGRELKIPRQNVKTYMDRIKVKIITHPT